MSQPDHEAILDQIRASRIETSPGLRARVRAIAAAPPPAGASGRELPWRTHVLLAETEDERIAAGDPAEIEAARWGTLDELAGPLRDRLLSTDRAFWRYRVALHDAAIGRLRA